MKVYKEYMDFKRHMQRCRREEKARLSNNLWSRILAFFGFNRVRW